MFTGLVEELGKIKDFKKSGESMVLTIEAKEILRETAVGDSIAVNGVCLTVTSFSQSAFTVDVMPETMRKTSLRDVKTGSSVNLERAMTPNRRFGGHFVSGHVDGIATLIERKPLDNAIYLTFKTEEDLLNYMLPKGSIAIDGISLTLVEVKNETFSVSIIPHTLQQTNLGTKRIGEIVNIEADMIGKYVEKSVRNLLQTQTTSNGKITEEFLKENGF